MSSEAAIAGAANKIAVGGGGLALLGGMTASEFAAYAGVLIAALSALVSWYYRRRDSRMRAEEHGARMAMLEKGIDPDGD